MTHINNNTRPNSRDKVVDSQTGNFSVGATVSSEAATCRDIWKFAHTLSTLAQARPLAPVHQIDWLAAIALILWLTFSRPPLPYLPLHLPKTHFYNKPSISITLTVALFADWQADAMLQSPGQIWYLDILIAKYVKKNKKLLGTYFFLLMYRFYYW